MRSSYLNKREIYKDKIVDVLFVKVAMENEQGSSMLKLIQLLTFKLQFNHGLNLISYCFVVNRNRCGNVVCQTNSFLTPRIIEEKNI